MGLMYFCGINNNYQRKNTSIMEKSTKIIITVIIVVVFIALFAVVSGISSDAGAATPGIIGLILFAALIGGLRAVWKKDKNENQ